MTTQFTYAIKPALTLPQYLHIGKETISQMHNISVTHGSYMFRQIQRSHHQAAAHRSTKKKDVPVTGT